MRTVSFSQPSIVDQLNRDFVCLTTSTEGDPTAGQSIRHRPSDPAGPCIRGNGQQNVQTIFLTADGEIFHVITGYVSPLELDVELAFARGVFASLKSKSTDERADAVVTLHRERLAELGFSEREIDSPIPNFGGMAMPINFGNLDFSSLRGTQPQGLLRDANNGIGNPTTDPFASLIRNQVLTDQVFCMRHPLMSSEDLERDPTPLVGNGKSFFMSSSGGNMPSR